LASRAQDGLGSRPPEEDSMQQLLYVLPALACPVGMGAMMWFMMRGKDAKGNDAGMSQTQDEELTRLQAELDDLRARRADGDPGVSKPRR
jgi:hypothetical protein